MLPTDEERAKIQEAQVTNPELPLGSAEQFLLTLASITELGARLKLWLFKSDYENLEKVPDPWKIVSNLNLKFFKIFKILIIYNYFRFFFKFFKFFNKIF